MRQTALHSRTTLLLYALAFFTCLCLPHSHAKAQTAQVPEEVDSNFVIASIIIADPGDVLYSTVGHVGIHMQCPEHDLDYVFSYESEGVKGKVLRFLAGRLKMGMAAIPYQEYLDIYRAEGRGVKEYRLYLPIDTKRNLWRILDNHLMEGMYLPYDYMKRGCAYSTLQLLMEGMDTLRLEFGPWPEHFDLTRRELMEIRMDNYPWHICFLELIGGNGMLDSQCPKIDKVIIPEDLITVLSNAKVQGKSVLANEPLVILPSIHKTKVPFCTPTLVAIVILILTLINMLSSKRVMDYILLFIQTVLGLTIIYLVFFSSLVCTEWSWLIIPFNPLPLIFWRWRDAWSLPYAIALLIWALVILLWSHQLTDNTYVILSVALAVSYVNTYRLSKMSNRKQK